MFLEVYFSKVALIIKTETDRCKVEPVTYIGFIKQLYIAFIYCYLHWKPGVVRGNAWALVATYKYSRVVHKNE